MFPMHAAWARPFAAAAAAGNPKVFFDCAIDGKPAGRIVFELFNDVVPKVSIPLLFMCRRDARSYQSTCALRIDETYTIANLLADVPRCGAVSITLFLGCV